jgi:GNAT superfamily N-acetyltransferase
MEIMHYTDGINPKAMEECIKLAVAEAPAMVHQQIDNESPLLELAEAEVEILLGDSLRMVGSGATQRLEGRIVELKVGLIVAIDDEAETPQLAGFIQYKPRLLVDGMASIGYAAVATSYRGQGVFKMMMNELKGSYPILGLDCPLELVPLYQKLGFKVDNAQGCHVGMTLGELGGKNWQQDDLYLESQKLFQRAKESVRTKLGKNTASAYAKRDADTRNRTQEVRALLSNRSDK